MKEKGINSHIATAAFFVHAAKLLVQKQIIIGEQSF